jgi:hypothetical protein
VLLKKDAQIEQVTYSRRRLVQAFKMYSLYTTLNKMERLLWTMSRGEARRRQLWSLSTDYYGIVRFKVLTAASMKI